MPPVHSEKKRKTYSIKYYTLTEPEMQALLARAKLGDGSAQLELLKVFHNFLSKYTTLLFYGKYSLADYDIRRFISLFVKDRGVRQFLSKNKLNESGAKHVYECMRGIQYMIQRYGDEEDVDQTVKMAFLQCVSIYQRKEKVPFSGFLYSYFFFVLKKMVDAHLIDQLGRKTFPLIDDEDASDNDFESDEKLKGFTAPPVPGIDEFIGAEIIDEYWVAGDTVHPPFDILSIQDRQLLRWRYIDRERSSDIALRITEHPNTVREHFNRIKFRLREAINKDLGDMACGG